VRETEIARMREKAEREKERNGACERVRKGMCLRQRVKRSCVCERERRVERRWGRGVGIKGE